jgi:hypothetical protein
MRSVNIWDMTLTDSLGQAHIGQAGAGQAGVGQVGVGQVGNYIIIMIRNILDLYCHPSQT